ncbi:hemoglobin subunit alpha-3-like [Engystomops pustulosus]|uniref:hemoglobin subunit alpha-3-like n=1 Tax=Engystomops pustulosus TaxID=76066 RepID=UPI003AFB3625
MMNLFAVLIIWSKIILGLSQTPNTTISLTATELALVKDIWAKVTPQANELGAEMLERWFLSFPESKGFFARFDLSHGSNDLLIEGGKILNAFGNAINYVDDPAGLRDAIRDLRAYNLELIPENFPVLSHIIQVVLAFHFPDDFTIEAQAAVEKFLSEVSDFLISDHRSMHQG